MTNKTRDKIAFWFGIFGGGVLFILNITTHGQIPGGAKGGVFGMILFGGPAWIILWIIQKIHPQISDSSTETKKHRDNFSISNDNQKIAQYSTTKKELETAYKELNIAINTKDRSKILDKLSYLLPSKEAYEMWIDYTPKQLENAKIKFASKITDDEIILLFYDNTLLRNGKSGIIITNHSIYKSDPKECIPLQRIQSINIVKAGTTTLGATTVPRLIINDKCFWKGWELGEFIEKIIVNLIGLSFAKI